MEKQPLAHLLLQLLDEASDNGLEVLLAAAQTVPTPERAAVRAEYTQRYARAVQAVAAVRGAPSFTGTQRDIGYPNWHSGERIATWSDANGIVYVALSEDEGGPAIVAGARPHPFDRETITLLPPSD